MDNATMVHKDDQEQQHFWKSKWAAEVQPNINMAKALVCINEILRLNSLGCVRLVIAKAKMPSTEKFSLILVKMNIW